MDSKTSFQNYKSIIFSLHFINSIIQCFCCVYEKKNIRIISKMFIMPLIYLIYQILTEKKNRNTLINFGIILGWIGDIFMLSNQNSPLIIGAIFSFLIGHLFYILAFMKLSSSTTYKKKFYLFLFIILFYSYVCYIQFHYYLIEGFKKRNVLPHGIIYLSVLGIINSISTFNLLTKFNFSNFLIFVGTILFWVSDFILVRMLFYESLFYYHLIVISTYIIAQTSITIGMSLIET